MADQSKSIEIFGVIKKEFCSKTISKFSEALNLFCAYIEWHTEFKLKQFITHFKRGTFQLNLCISQVL